VVQQVLGESQCSNSILNQYLELCKQLARGLDTFSIRHVGQEDNKAANRLAQQASGYEVRRGKFSVLEESISCGAINADESAVTRVNDTTDEDWRVTLQRCIMDHGGTRDRKVLRQGTEVHSFGWRAIPQDYRRGAIGMFEWRTNQGGHGRST
jgi:hypothetical protein